MCMQEPINYWGWETAQSKGQDMSLSPKIHEKQKKNLQRRIACNPGTEELDIGGSLRFLAGEHG